MRLTSYLLCFLAAVPLQAWGYGKEVERKLREVDALLAEKALYDSRKEENIAGLRRHLGESASAQERWESAYRLYEEYSCYKYDSAFNYAQVLGRLAAESGNRDRMAQATIAKVYCLINAGLYKEAFDEADSMGETESLSPEVRLAYYGMMVKLNYAARDYAQTVPYWGRYTEAGESFTQKILRQTTPESRIWQEYNANLLMESRRYEDGVRAFGLLLADPGLDLHSRAIYASSLGWMLEQLDREDDALVYICESALCDIKSSTKETTALRMLADNLSRRGEVERPTRYVRESFEDANFYNARLRKLEVGAVLPLVEKNHYDNLSRQHRLLIASILMMVLIVAAVVIALWFIRRQNRRLHEAKKDIEERNRLLTEANAIKVEYIGNSFYINAEFIEKMSQLYKLVDRMLVTRQYDELRRSLKESTLDKERDLMYASFDNTFLKIFPTFVNDYNALFPEQEQSFPSSGLTPEMRIFALIRLGIQETERIARFLNYSVHTINTYKTRVKNKSVVENDRFEEAIMKIGAK